MANEKRTPTRDADQTHDDEDLGPGPEGGKIRGLNFIYQEQRSDGQQSNFFRLENPGREDA